MKWKLRDGGYAPNIAVSTAEKAAKEHEVPVGILLGTVECESDFRLGLTSSAGGSRSLSVLAQVRGGLLPLRGVRV